MQIAQSGILDSAFLYTTPVAQIMRHYHQELKLNFQPTLQKIIDNSFLPSDQHKAFVSNSFVNTPSFVWTSAFESMLEWDRQVETLLKKCSLPLLYIEATHLVVDISRFKQLCPQLMHGKGVGSGHFIPLEIPHQVNAMIDHFMKIHFSL